MIFPPGRITSSDTSSDDIFTEILSEDMFPIFCIDVDDYSCFHKIACHRYIYLVVGLMSACNLPR